MRNALLLLSLLALSIPRPAEACGFMSASIDPTEMPSAAHEDVLIVYDDAKQIEHFIRRVRFKKASSKFGFVIPTPSVARVDEANEAIWKRLRLHCPHRFGDPGVPPTQSYGLGSGKRRSASATKVKVLEQKKLGDFTAFVLAASDTAAFDDWLNDNGFSPTDGGRAWLERYVKAKFHFVALRYDGSEDAGAGELLSKTVRISFKTPLPFYPYREPEDVRANETRKLLVWFVGKDKRVPVAEVMHEGERLLRRPWSEANPCGAVAHEALADLVGTELAGALPVGATLQAFADVKEHRHGWSDVLMHSIGPSACDAACIEARLPLVSILSSLVDEAPAAEPDKLVIAEAPKPQHARAPKPSPAPAAPAASAPSAPPSSSCAMAPEAGGRAAVLWLFALLLILRRREALVSLLLLLGCSSCEAQGPTTAPTAASAPSSRTADAEPEAPVPFALSTDPSQARSALLELLAGHRNHQLIKVWSQPAGEGLGAIDLPHPEALPTRMDIQKACTAGVEAVLHYEIHYRDGAAERATVEGAVPAAMRDCVRQRLLESFWPLPAKSADRTHVESGAYGVGKLDASLAPHRKRVHARERLPRRGTKLGKLTAGDGLPPEVIQRVVRANFGRFRACYQHGLATQPDLSGRVAVKFTIDPQGGVVDAHAEGTLPDKKVVSCIERAFAALTFPSPGHGKPINVTFPLEFSPTG